MKKQYLKLEKQRDFSQKINDTFTFVRLNFRDFFLALLLIVGPVLLIAGIAGGIHQINFLSNTGLNNPNMGENASFTDIVRQMSTRSKDMMGPAYFIMLISALISSILLVTTVYSFMQCYYEDATNRITIDRVTEKVKLNFMPVFRGFFLVVLVFFGIFMLAGLALSALSTAVGGGASSAILIISIILIFFATFYFMIMFLLSPAIIVFEGAGPGLSLRRAKYLIQGKWWSTFGLVFIITILVYILAVIFSLPASFLTVLKMLHIQNSLTNDYVVVITTAISTVGTTILSSIVYIALGFQYFNLVERKEGNGLFRQINDLGTH